MNEDQLSQLKLKLDELHTWPDLYMFKFIIPLNEEKKAKVVSTFSDAAKITFKESSKGTFISITVVERCLSGDYVIDKYRNLQGIEGLISL